MVAKVAMWLNIVNMGRKRIIIGWFCQKTWLGNVEYVKVSSSGCCDYFNNKNGSSDKDNSGYHE